MSSQYGGGCRIAIFSDSQLRPLEEEHVDYPRNWYINSTPGGKFMHVSQEIKDCPLESIPDTIVLLVGTNDMALHAVMDSASSTNKCTSADFKELLLSTRSRSCSALAAAGSFCPRLLSDFDALLKAEAGLIVVDFYADWCGPCRIIAPKIESLSQIYTDVVFAKVNVDENADTAESCGVNAMPTFMLYKNGAKVGEVIGANENKVKELIEKNK
eukprot:Seg1441.2 transcript_id=Seg1441.2/GoldUCD/mRNA.D3Y31 product=Thioredoxin-1 protein_id=Seg1441.2/GoldUCD/D3Y31